MNNTTHVVSTAYDDETGRTIVTDIVIGILMIILSTACGLAYSFILMAMYKDRELLRLPSYRIMFVLGILDVIQCFPHFVTGFFTIFQTIFHYEFAKFMGVLATPCYVGYAVLTIILSFNRFIQLYSRHLDEILFSPMGMRIWIGIALFITISFACALSSPYAAIIYIPEWYSWGYDTSPYSHIVQRVEMYIEVIGIFISGFFYILVIILLTHKRKKFMVTSSSGYVELKILIQASVITIYCTILNVFWHNYELLLPANIWSYTALNFMWIANSGVYPLIYVIVNRAIRQRIRGSRVGVTTISQTPKSHFHR